MAAAAFHRAPVEGLPGMALSQIGVREKILIFLFCNFLTFDFKGKSTGGNVFQLLLVVLTIAAGALIILQNKEQRPIKAAAWISGLLGGAVALNYVNTIIASMTNVRDFDVLNSLRMSAALILAPLGLMVVHTLARRGYSMSVVMKPIIFSGVVSAFWRLFIGRKDLDSFSLSDARWEILSPIMFLLAGVGLIGFLYNRKVDWVAYLCVLTFVFCAVASATRSLFLSAGGSLVVIPILWVLSGRLKDTRFIMRLITGSVLALMVGALGVTALTALRPDGLDSLASRNSADKYRDPQGNPHDVTLMLREAQITGMQREMVKSPYSMVFGKGLGVPYYLDRYYEGSVPTEWFYTGAADFSDLGLLYLIYSLGWSVGLGIVVLMGVMPFVGVWAAAKLSRIKAEDESLQVARAAASIAAFFTLNFTWAGTYERGSMLVFGILTGVILVGLHRARGGSGLTLEQIRMNAIRRAVSAV